jgi:hypothetical protein
MMISWRVHHPDAVLASMEEKGALVQALMSVYTQAGIPLMDVHVVFARVPSDHVWIGGVSTLAIDVFQLHRAGDLGQDAGAWNSGSPGTGSLQAQTRPPFVRLHCEQHALLLTQNAGFVTELNSELEIVSCLPRENPSSEALCADGSPCFSPGHRLRPRQCSRRLGGPSQSLARPESVGEQHGPKLTFRNGTSSRIRVFVVDDAGSVL